jgi:predicted outer membrane protein
MFKLATCCVVLMSATAAMAQSTAEKTGINAVAGIAPTTQDFVTEAAQSDMFEIQSSKLALNSADAPTKEFAQKMHAGGLSSWRSVLSGVVTYDWRSSPARWRSTVRSTIAGTSISI